MCQKCSAKHTDPSKPNKVNLHIKTLPLLIFGHTNSAAYNTFMGSSDNKGSFHSHVENHESLHDQTGSFPCRRPITDPHSTKLRSLFSCHFHSVEGHSASSVKWLCPFNRRKRTKLSMLCSSGLRTKIGMKQRGKGRGVH